MRVFIVGSGAGSLQLPASGGDLRSRNPTQISLRPATALNTSLSAIFGSSSLGIWNHHAPVPPECRISEKVADSTYYAAAAGTFAAFFRVVFAARFFDTAGFSAAFAAWNAAQRFRTPSAIARLPAALSFRFGFGVPDAEDGCDVPLDSAHRFRCASPIRFRAAALIFRRLLFGTSSVVAGSVRPPRSMARSSAI